MQKHSRAVYVFLFLILLALSIYLYFNIPTFVSDTYESDASVATFVEADIAPEVPEKFVAAHIVTPEQVKAIYMTSWVAGTKDIRDGLVKLIDEKEINAVVIDIKDYSGKITFLVEDETLKEIGSAEDRVRDMREFIEYLHSKNIYVIGRISAFQDQYLVQKWPDLAVLRSSDKGIWKDRKGISWLDPGSEKVWEYLVLVGKEAYASGFDELNFDYIRFPADGDMKDIYYPVSEGRVKADVLEEFFAYLQDNLKDTGAKLSADVFGMTTTENHDLGIGQVLSRILPYFDYVAPMVYPSHYPKNYQGFAVNPAEKPYEVVKFAMDKAITKALTASSTPEKLRPWLQDFDLGADYDAEKVRAQIKAVYDSGLTSWMLWAPSNKYTADALNDE